ncbi:glycosyltransferase family 9 protein [Mesorhizobium sp. VK23B]|uniref:Glycosyltransferase family 9 protein n=1 Tax=Mesorhizobium dulcispinae TaxID=3072316 RepID=A0ABU4XPS3_9HYPH|nr:MULTISPECIES: glycosyltransferase family 9 protein [unclassified Mesorhizobium]MDX8470197.1 glycosyltransferase family 9 protein [Mesorhizobium sp. VK23B]MDX8476583.1 glycosyltransferase family 9 protein [Mesorhizobium sp. VK23A]
MRVLVLKLDHVGDFWMALGPLKELRRRFSHAHITLAVGSWNIETAREFGLADDYIAFNFFSRNPAQAERREEAASIGQMLTGDFDLAIDMRVPDETRPVLLAVPARHRAAIVDRYGTDGIDIAIAPFNLKLRRTIFYKLAQKMGIADRIPRRWLDWFTDRDQMRLQHVTEILSFLVAKTAAYFDSENEADKDATTKGAPIVMAPFSNSALRDWPAEYFGQLAAALAKRGDVIVVGRSENRAAIEKVVKIAGDLGAARVGIAVDLPELEFNRLIRSAALVVSNNSGTGHVAAQLGRPTVGIFTASHLPEIWGFQGPVVSMLMSSIECRGCGLDQVHRCPVGVRCKFDIKPDRVLAEINLMTNYLRSNPSTCSL